MKSSKHPSLKLNSKVLVVFEKKKHTGDHNIDTDTTPGTITLTTGIGTMIHSLKKCR